MEADNTTFSLSVEGTAGSCPSGENWGTRNIPEGKIPVISCEGACIHSDIFEIDDVPEEERKKAARQVADEALSAFASGSEEYGFKDCCAAQSPADCCQKG